MKTRRKTPKAIVAAATAALTLAATALPAHALVGTRGQHPVTGDDRDAPSNYAELSYPALPVVALGESTTVTPTAFTNPDGSEVTDPAAAGYSFSTHWTYDTWVGDFDKDDTVAGADGSLTFTPEYYHVPGVREAGIIIDNPDLGTAEYQLLRFQLVDGDVADLTDPSMDAVTYPSLLVQPGYPDDRSPSVADRETGDALERLPEGYTAALGEADPERGWTVPDFVTVDPDGTVHGAPQEGEPYAEYRVPIVITEEATGATTTTTIDIEVGEVVYKGPFGNFSAGETSTDPLLESISSNW